MDLRLLSPGDVVVRRGTYVYDGTAVGDLCIVETRVRQTFGVPAIDPAFRDDHPGPWFDVHYTSAGVRDQFTNGVTGFGSLDEALRWISATFAGVVWRA